MPQKKAITSISDVDIRLLQVFRTVVWCGGFTAAEFELNISRSTISKHIADLETRLGAKLCHRGAAGFSLTSDGQYVLDSSNELFLAIDKFQNGLGDVRSELTGKLRIALFDHSTSNEESNLDEAIRLFIDKAPGVTLDISMEPPNIIEEGVINGRFNLGIVPLHRQSPMLSYSELYVERMRLFCGREHELFHSASDIVPLNQLRKYNYAGLSFNSPNMAVHQKLMLRKSAFVQNEESLMLLVLSGRYLGFVPTHKARALVKDGFLKQINCPEAEFSSTMAAIVRKSASKGRRLNLFLDILRKAHES